MNGKIKLGLIGTGHMGQYHVNVALGLPTDYEVAGIFDASPTRRTEISERFGVPAFEDVGALMDAADAVVVAVPTALHYEVARQALEKGKHVLVEKPMTTDVEHARELVELAESKGLILQVGHVERFNGAVLELRRVVDKPVLIESRRLAPNSGRIQDVGVVMDLLIHDLDIIMNLVGEEVTSVEARGVARTGKHEDVATAVLQFEGGCVATITASRLTQSKIRTLTITQESAYILLDFSTQDIDIHRQATSAYLMTREELKYRQESFVEKIFVHKDNPLRQEHMHFVKCVRGQETPIVSGASDIRTIEIASRILTQIHGHHP
ncbi:MAG TPA: Gfo/Idh/MocA family oxidoreductase [Leptospiraceae bacterium]|nr:Gfo/Idh/MocA family oxidoreductase [Leptospiraceae bacterium]